MKRLLSSLTAAALLSIGNFSVADEAACPEILQHQVRKLRSQESVDFCERYQGKALLIVNTASSCGFTPQFKGLEALNQEYGPQGLAVIGFPSDDFKQEAKNEEETAKVCYVNYGVNFDMYATGPVRGDDAQPIFKQLAQAEGAPKWNFYKYLVNRNGEVVEGFSSMTTPEDAELRSAIESALAAQ